MGNGILVGEEVMKAGAKKNKMKKGELEKWTNMKQTRQRDGDSTHL